MRILCPGKVMLAGEYAVVDGGPALLLGVDAHAVATVEESEQGLSPFLAEVHLTMVKEFGEKSDEARAALRVRVDTSAFHQDSIKLGLGSSAAATVAACAAALAASGHTPSAALVHPLAARAHADAQGKAGASGSGADVAACSYGGCLRFQHSDSGPLLQPVSLPKELLLRFPWTGVAASTPSLVQHVQRFRAAHSEDYAKLAGAISESAEALATCASAQEAILAIQAGAEALRALAQATGAMLWLPEHDLLAELAEGLGGTLKPTGAGGGDLAVAAFSDPESARQFEICLAERGIACPALDVDTQGVRLQA